MIVCAYIHRLPIVHCERNCGLAAIDCPFIGPMLGAWWRRRISFSITAPLYLALTMSYLVDILLEERGCGPPFMHVNRNTN